jgi:hypothetical protein
LPGQLRRARLDWILISSNINVQMELSMSRFAIGDRVDKATGDHEDGVVVAVFATDDGNFRYAVDMEGYGALQFLTEEKLVVHRC